MYLASHQLIDARSHQVCHESSCPWHLSVIPCLSDSQTLPLIHFADIVDTLPWLDYLPRFLAPWKKAGDEVYEFQRKLFMRHLEDVKRDMAEGREARCFTQAMLNLKNQGLLDLQIAFLGGTMVRRKALLLAVTPDADIATVRCRFRHYG